MLGISIKKEIGIGDAVQFSSLPENYFRATGKRLVDVSHSWIFDHNPFVIRNKTPRRVIELWNFSPRKYDWPCLRSNRVYLSNAEIHASVMGVPAKLNRPRLYFNEDFPFEKREKILIHIDGKSHGVLPEHVIEHMLFKYGETKKLFQIGKSERDLGVPKIKTETVWDLVKVISECRMLIGADSGPSWIAACYPDIVIRKVRNRHSPERLENWVPLEVDNYHAHWDDRIFQIFNTTENDIGAFSSYRKL